MNQSLLCAALCAAFTAAPLFAGQVISDGKESKKSVVEECPPDALWVMAARGSWTGESDFKRGDDAKGSSTFGQFEASRRFAIPDFGWPTYECGQWYLRAGLDYQRWDFDNSGGLPIPNHLQSISATIALEYLVRGRTAVLIETEPGFYFEDDIEMDTFDAPTKAAAVFSVSDKFFLVGGVSYASLRSYPLIPIVGFVWNATDRLSFNLVPPEPRVIYALNDNLKVWAGGELAGGSFRVDGKEVPRKSSLNDAVVTYTETRAGLGFSYTSGALEFELGGGYAFQRKFNYHRAEEGFETDEGAPYVKAELRAAF